MSYQKITNLVREICRKTYKGLIDWEATEKEGVYQVSFSNYSVRLFLAPSMVQSGSNDYVIQIINSDGALVEETNDEEMKDLWSDAYHEMKQAHDMIRRKIMGVEDALDSILEELNNDN